jgi:hypothetical protein
MIDLLTVTDPTGEKVHIQTSYVIRVRKDRTDTTHKVNCHIDILGGIQECQETVDEIVAMLEGTEYDSKGRIA